MWATRPQGEGTGFVCIFEGLMLLPFIGTNQHSRLHPAVQSIGVKYVQIEIQQSRAVAGKLRDAAAILSPYIESTQKYPWATFLPLTLWVYLQSNVPGGMFRL